MSDPISTSSGNSNVTFTGTAGTFSASTNSATAASNSTQPTDSFSTWDNSLLGYLNNTGNATISAQIAINAADVVNSKYEELLYEGLSLLGGDLVTAQLGNAPTVQTNFSQYIKANNNLNEAATTYNTAVDTASTNLSAVINNASTTNTQKNAAIATYNTAIANATTAYNAVITAFNNAAPANIAVIASTLPGLNAYYKANTIPTAANPYSFPIPLPSSYSLLTATPITGTFSANNTPTLPNPPTVTAPPLYNFVPSVSDIVNESYNGNLDPTQQLWRQYSLALGTITNAANTYNQAITSATAVLNQSVGGTSAQISAAISTYNTAIANAAAIYTTAQNTFSENAPNIVSQIASSIPVINDYYKNNNIPSSSSPYVISSNLPTSFPGPTASSITTLTAVVVPSLVTIPNPQLPTPSDVLKAELKGAPSTIGNGSWQSYLSQLNVVSDAVSVYNSSLDAAAATLNASAGTSADVTAYNTKISAASTVYQNAVSNFNTVAPGLVQTLIPTLSALNTYFQNSGIPNKTNPTVITQSDLPTSAPTITASSLSGPSLPISVTANQLDLASQTPELSVLNAVFPNAALTTQALLAAVSGMINSIQFKVFLHDAAINPFNTTKNKMIPDSYIDAIPPEFFSTSTQGGFGRSVGPSASLNGQGIATSLIGSVLGNGVYNQILTQLRLNPDQQTLLSNGLNQLAQTNLAKAASNAGISTAATLKSLNINSVDQNPAATTVASAISFGQSVLSAVNATGANSISAQVSALLNSLGFSTDGTSDLTAALKLSLTTNAAAFVSTSLNLPGILPQLLNNIDGVSTAGGETNALSLLLQNPLSLIAIKMALLSALQNPTTSTTPGTTSGSAVAAPATPNATAAQINAINDSVNQAAAAALLASKEESLTKSTFLQNLMNTLGQQDTFDTADIQGLGIKANSALDTELRVSGLDTPFTELSLAQLNSRLTSDTQNQIAQSQALQASISAALAQNPQTNRQFNASLVSALQSNQAFASADQANRFADVVTNQLAPPTVKASNEPLKGVGAGNTLSTSELYQQLTTDVNSRLAGVSSAIPNAPDLASKLVALSMGPHSFLTTLNENTKHLVYNGHAQVLKEINGVADSVETPTVPLYQAANVVSNIVKQQVEGYMNPVRGADLRNADDSKEPSNYLKNISIRI